MSLLATPPPRVSSQDSILPHADWITPEKQIEKLALPIAAELVNKNRDRLSLLRDSPLEQAMIECAIQSIVRKSNLFDNTFPKSVPSLMQMAVDHFLEPPPLPPYLTNWYTAHRKLGWRCRKIPPLPRFIYQIMNSICPIYGHQKRPDETRLKVKDTHFLSLLPKELGTINQFERDLKRYEMQVYPSKATSLQFHHFWYPARQEHGDKLFPETQWVLMTQKELPKSSWTTWADKVKLVGALKNRSYVEYEIPTLQQGFAAIATNIIANEEQVHHESIFISTCVKEKTLGSCLAITGDDHFDLLPDDIGSIGVAVLRKL